ncbi:MAG TPA: PilZ domain-containing protein [Vicinamibacterales bacterium]|nr:PilZ domain-containing protein [Vicinamibacterales bacterium]
MPQPANSPKFIPQRPRRESPRIPGPFEARLVGDSSVAVNVRDLSTAGCFLDAHELVGPLSPVMKLHVELPWEGWITAQVQVVYRLERQGVAMKFVGLDAATRDRIEREIQRAISEAGI